MVVSQDELRLGLIGCGETGVIHARCVEQIDGARFLAFADIHRPAADAVRERFGGEYATAEPARVIDDPRIDAVYICTHHDSHADLACAAANAGKHVLMEKPLALSTSKCEVVARVVRSANIVFMPAFKLRFYPLIQRAQKFIARPQLIVCQMMDRRWDDHAWSQDPQRGGANVSSQGCHMTDMFRFFARGEVTRVVAVGGAVTHPNHPCIDHCVASLQFDNGCMGSWVQGDAAVGQLTGKMFLQLFGEGRSVQIHDRGKRAVFHDGQDTWVEQREQEEGFELESRAFIAALRDGAPLAVTVDDAVEATRLVEAATRAAVSRQPQSLVKRKIPVLSRGESQ